MIIYKVTNTVNNKSYIGQTRQSIQERKQRHLYSTQRGSKLAFHCALRKYGFDNFTWEILETADTPEELPVLEAQYIKKYRTFTEGYNMTSGGEHYELSEISRQKISKKLTGRHKTEEHRRNLSEALKGREGWWKGRKRSEENLENISKALKGKPAWNRGLTDVYTAEQLAHYSEVKQGKNNPMYGKKQKVVKCPHCKTEVPVNLAKRWHFDNCKVVDKN